MGVLQEARESTLSPDVLLFRKNIFKKIDAAVAETGILPKLEYASSLALQKPQSIYVLDQILSVEGNKFTPLRYVFSVSCNETSSNNFGCVIQESKHQVSLQIGLSADNIEDILERQCNFEPKNLFYWQAYDFTVYDLTGERIQTRNRFITAASHSIPYIQGTWWNSPSYKDFKREFHNLFHASK